MLQKAAVERGGALVTWLEESGVGGGGVGGAFR